MKKFSLVIILVSFFWGFSQKAPKDFPITNTATEAFALQQETQKPIVFFFFTDWCKYCFAMKKNTFTHKETIALLNENFHFVLFNAESKETITLKDTHFKNKNGTHELAIALASKNGYINYPSLVILNKNNTIDEQISTFLPAKKLNKLLNKYLTKKSDN